MRIALDLPPGLDGDDTAYGADGRWADGSNVRFRLGKPEVIGGWESLTGTLLTGVCRTVFAWTDNSAVLNIACGTHSKLQVIQDSTVYDITPFGAPALLGTNPLATTNGSAVVTVTHTAHGRTTADSVKIFGAVDTAGIAAANLNGTRTITVTGANTYTFVAASNATSTLAAGGGSSIVITPQVALPAGAQDGTGGSGWGTGAFSVGTYSSPSTAEFFPRTWSFGAWGQELLASPRGGGLYKWSNVTATRAVAVNNAPTQISYMLVAPVDGGYMTFALGCNEEVSGTFNPMCIRHSKIRDETVWSTTASGSTAREYILVGGGRIVGGAMAGPYLLAWTDSAIFVGTFVGALNQPWKFERVGRNCGLIGPNAAVVMGQTAYWMTPDRQFFSYGVGGQPLPIPCPILSDVADHISDSQSDKIVASSNSGFGEVRFDYPDDRDGVESSRYAALCVTGPDAGAWHKGEMARTAFIDGGLAPYPVGVDPTGAVFYHEKGASADGSMFAWRIKTAAQLLDPDRRILIRGLWPDFKDQVGPISVTVYTRETPQGDVYSVTADPMSPSDAKADLLITGRLFEVEFSGNSSPTSMRLGKPIFDCADAGRL